MARPKPPNHTVAEKSTQSPAMSWETMSQEKRSSPADFSEYVVLGKNAERDLLRLNNAIEDW
jgi:hypothetical protein